MVSFRFTCILAFLACVTLITACVGGRRTMSNSSAAASNQANENANTAETNVEELSVLVNIPYETEDIVWKDDSANKKLVAVLRFSPADSAKLVAEAEKIRPPISINFSTESWFPAELIAQSDMSGDGTLNGKSYAANNFLQEPYIAGSIARIENTDYFVLEASAR